jgi:hypothetical protein
MQIPKTSLYHPWLGERKLKPQPVPDIADIAMAIRIAGAEFVKSRCITIQLTFGCIEER